MSDFAMNPPADDGAVARHGWAALLKLLQAKGLITEEEARAVIMTAHSGAQWRGAFGSSDQAQQMAQLLAAPAPAPPEAT